MRSRRCPAPAYGAAHGPGAAGAAVPAPGAPGTAWSGKAASLARIPSPDGATAPAHARRKRRQRPAADDRYRRGTIQAYASWCPPPGWGVFRKGSQKDRQGRKEARSGTTMMPLREIKTVSGAWGQKSAAAPLCRSAVARRNGSATARSPHGRHTGARRHGCRRTSCTARG